MLDNYDGLTEGDCLEFIPAGNCDTCDHLGKFNTYGFCKVYYHDVTFPKHESCNDYKDWRE